METLEAQVDWLDYPDLKAIRLDYKGSQYDTPEWREVDFIYNDGRVETHKAEELHALEWDWLQAMVEEHWDGVLETGDTWPHEYD